MLFRKAWIRTLPTKPDPSSIFTNASGRALHWVPMITQGLEMRPAICAWWNSFEVLEQIRRRAIVGWDGA